MEPINGHDLDVLDKAVERPTVLKVIRDHHHRIARLIAEGRRTNDVAAEVGMAVSRISILKGDPAFRALIEHYRERVDEIRDEIFATAQQKAALLRENALDTLNERYEDDPSSITDEMARQHLMITNEMLENKPSVQLHGNLKDLPLAEIVNLRRARADQLQKASQRLLPVGEAKGPSSNSSCVSDSAPTKQTNET